MLTVLVADDEFAVLEVLAMSLEAEGHRVLKAGDGADALRILVSQPCDVVVCDEVMPVLSGRQLVDAMRADPRLQAVPVVMLVDMYRRSTASPPEGVVMLEKPLVLKQLLRAVDAAGTSRPPRKPHT